MDNQLKRAMTGSKFIAGSLTVIFLVILIITGSAQALFSELKILSNTVVQKGESVSFLVTLNVNDNEVSNLKSIVLTIDGPKQVSCKFKKDGTIIDGCKDIKIEKLSSDPDPYGYSYDYGYNSDPELKYKITLDTKKYFSGSYRTMLYTYIGSHKYTQKGENFYITEKTLGCSLRANNGDLFVNGDDFGRSNMLNLYNSNRNAMQGSGSLVAQSCKGRLIYNFKVESIEQNDNTHAIIHVNGKYRIGRGVYNPEIPEKATLIVDKRNNKVKVVGNDLNVEYMNVNLRAGCSSI